MRLPAPLRHGCGALLAFVLTAALAPLAAAQGLSDKAKPQAYADPADAISADLAFLRLAREKGLATAAKATAAPEAKIVQGSNLQWPAVPTPSTLADFLTHSAATYGVPRWPVQQVWMSCDGAVAVTAGVLESHVTGVTVWQRQKKGGYKWLLHMDDFASSLPAPAPANPAASEDAADAEMISASVAECPARARHGGAMPATATPPPTVAAVSGDLAGVSPDGSLAWAYALQQRAFTLRLKRDGALQNALGAVGIILPPTPAPLPLSSSPVAHH